MPEIALRETFGNFLVENGKKYKDLVVLDADLSSSTRTSKFAKAFPNRFFNMGIAEQNMLGTALGFAISGKIPVVSGFSIFTTGRSWEFIRLACLDNLNLKIVTTHGGIVGEDGSTHNALEDLSLMASLPNMNVLVPADNIELIQMLKYALESHGPFYIRLPRGAFPKIHDDNYNFLCGNPDILKEGSDFCLIGTGYGTILAHQSAKLIEEQFDLSIKVINISTIKPINEIELLKHVKNLRGIITIEEHNIYCGFGSIIARILSQNYSIPMRFLGVKDLFVQSGKRELLLNAHGLNTRNIITLIKEMI